MPGNRLIRIVLFCLSVMWIPGCGGGGGNETAPVANELLPDAPSAIIADAGNARVILRWSPVADAETYNVYYADTPGVTFENGILVEDMHSPYTHRDLQNGKTYYFAVASVNTHGEGPFSHEVFAIPSATAPPPAPGDIVAASESGRIRVSWSASTGANNYTIYYGTAPGVTPLTGVQVSNAASPQMVGSLLNETAYFFVVTAENANGESAASFEVSAIPLSVPPPLSPADVTAVEGNGKITLTWSAVNDARTYNVYYATDLYLDKETGTKITDIGNSPVTIPGLTNKTAYFLFVTAENSYGESVQSATVSATPLAQKPVHQLMEIPAGEFQMGDNLDGTAYALPVHRVVVDAFYIDRYETTYELWKTVYDWAIVNGYGFDNPGLNGSHGIGTNLPVTAVTWYDVVKWLNARSEKEGRTQVYYTDSGHTSVYRTGKADLTSELVDWDADGYRLPTEAEWEKATRGGLTGKRYPWGDDLGGTANANFNMGRSVSVGIYPPNGFGLYDMTGNVWEWTWDFGSNDYSWAWDGIVNPRGPDSHPNFYRVRRGGAYTYGDVFLRCYERMLRPPTYVAPYFGFRAASIAP